MKSTNRRTGSIISVAVIAIILIFPGNSYCQNKNETRAVWVATNYGLDWPAGRKNAADQVAYLNEIFADIKQNNYNTVYFQVRSGGFVLYPSAIEPFAENITGNISYDPLAEAVKAARNNGLSIHAWINSVRVFTGTPGNLPPGHPLKKHPERIVKYQDSESTSYWLDPALPQTGEYIASIASEIARNYDVDGIQLDFIRYPGIDFNDNKSYGLYGNGENKNNWRRRNITRIIRRVYEEVKMYAPNTEIGATPVGVNKRIGNTTVLEGYGNVYQDAAAWTKEKIYDYIVPQVYWDMNTYPYFDKVAASWAGIAPLNKIIIGMALYKNGVKEEFGKLIDYTRQNNFSGFAVFRYADIVKLDKNFCFPVSYIFPESISVAGPELISAELAGQKLKLKVKPPPSGITRFYSIYISETPEKTFLPENYKKLVPTKNTSIKILLPSEHKTWYIGIKGVGVNWQESGEGKIIAAGKGAISEYAR